MIISYEEFARMAGADQRSPSLVQHLLDIPTVPEDEELQRIEISPRPALVD